MVSVVATSQRDPGRWMVLFACIIAVLMVAIDSGLLTLIVPSIQKDLNASQVTIGLMSSISTLMLAAFILGGGTLGDLYGRRRFILIGTGGIIAASILSMMTPSVEALIGIRAIDGICQAFVNPLALAILTVTFDAEERPKALGIYGATLGILGGVSSLAVQFLNQSFGWRSVFLLVIGLGVLTLFLMLRFVSESRAAGSRKLDWIGILLCAAGLFALIYGISQASGVDGFFTRAVLLPCIAGLAILGVFILWEARVPSPALELSLFRQPAFSLGTLLILIFSFAQTGVFFHLSNYFQVLQGKTPVQSALILMPLTLSLFCFSLVAGALANRFPSRVLILAGTILSALALFLFSWFISPSVSIWALLVPMLLLGAGFSVANIPRMNALLSSAPPALAGIASATNNAVMQLGNAMGVAVTVALVTMFGRNFYRGELTKAGLTSEQIERVNELLQQVLRSDVPSIAAQQAIAEEQLEGLVGNYQGAFTTGVAQMFLIAGIVLVVSALLVWFGFPADASPKNVSNPLHRKVVS